MKIGSRNKKFATRFLKAISLLTLIIVFALSLMLFAACDDKGDDAPKAKLIFSDEFDADALDTAVWDVHGSTPKEGEPGEVRRGGWWTEDSVFLKDGELVIRTTYDPEKNTFYTGSIDTKELFTYGYYEARCKMPEAYGIWSAFWIMCHEMGLEEPDAHIGGAEIDIFESPYYSGTGGIQHAVHTAGYGDKKADHSTFPPIGLKRSEGVENCYEEWHTFALDWQPEYYKFYVDGELTWETCAPYHSKKLGIDYDINVSSIPSYIILSVEVGGNGGVPGDSPFFGGGNPIKGNAQKYDMNDFSVDFLVDYVKVWDINPYL